MIRDSFTFSSGDLSSTTENYKLQHRFHRFSLIRIAGDVQDLVIVQAQLVEGKRRWCSPFPPIQSSSRLRQAGRSDPWLFQRHPALSKFPAARWC